MSCSEIPIVQKIKDFVMPSMNQSCEVKNRARVYMCHMICMMESYLSTSPASFSKKLNSHSKYRNIYILCIKQ